MFPETSVLEQLANLRPTTLANKDFIVFLDAEINIVRLKQLEEPDLTSLFGPSIGCKAQFRDQWKQWKSNLDSRSDREPTSQLDSQVCYMYILVPLQSAETVCFLQSQTVIYRSQTRFALVIKS